VVDIRFQSFSAVDYKVNLKVRKQTFECQWCPLFQAHFDRWEVDNHRIENIVYIIVQKCSSAPFLSLWCFVYVHAFPIVRTILDTFIQVVFPLFCLIRKCILWRFFFNDFLVFCPFSMISFPFWVTHTVFNCSFDTGPVGVFSFFLYIY